LLVRLWIAVRFALLADDPNDINARHNLALLLARRHDFSEADTLWMANIQSSDFLPSRIAYAGSLADRGQREAAIVQYQQIVAGKPEYVGAHEALAKLYLEQNQADRALTEIEGGLVRSPSNTTLLELRGDVHSRRGEIDAARADWQAAVGLAPDRAARSRLNQKLRSPH